MEIYVIPTHIYRKCLICLQASKEAQTGKREREREETETQRDRETERECVLQRLIIRILKVFIHFKNISFLLILYYISLTIRQ